MKSILEKFNLLDEQDGAGSSTGLKCSGDILKSISPIDMQPMATIRCATVKDYEQIIVRAVASIRAGGCYDGL